MEASLLATSMPTDTIALMPRLQVAPDGVEPVQNTIEFLTCLKYLRQSVKTNYQETPDSSIAHCVEKVLNQVQLN